MPLLLILAAVMSEWKVPSEYRMYLIMMMLSLIGWYGLARHARTDFVAEGAAVYDTAEVLGLSDKRKILYHLLPNTLPLLLVAATLHVAGAMLSESALSFLGLGVAPPTPSWGNMMEAANHFMDFTLRPWLWIPPGTVIF